MSGLLGRRRWVRTAVAALVFVGGLGFLLFKGVGSALDYYLTVPQAVAKRVSLGSSSFRLEGVVAPGSVRRTGSGVDFSVTGGGKEIPVVVAGQPPQLFQVGIPVVLVGRFRGDAFDAGRIMVKHTSIYQPAAGKSPSRPKVGTCRDATCSGARARQLPASDMREPPPAGPREQRASGAGNLLVSTRGTADVLLPCPAGSLVRA